MIKKILNKVLYAVVIALVFAFINRGCAKALDTPFYLTGDLNYNIAKYNSGSNDYYLNSRSRSYDFSKLYQDNVNYFNNYNYFFITIYSNPSTSNYYIVELYFANSVSDYGSNSWISGDFKRLRYNTNVLNNNDDIFGSDTFTITTKIDESNQSYISVVGYYGLPFHSSFVWNDISNFNNDYAIPLIKQQYYNYYAVPRNPSSNPRFVIFSNCDRTVLIYNESDSIYSTTYNGYIGEPINTIDYKIEFSAINSTNNSQEIFGNDNTITGAGIAIKYTPLDNELYNYYYYWEKDEGQDPIGDPNDISDWVQLDNSDKGIGVVVVDSNGWLYAKITDKNGNMLANNVLNYKAYGKTSLFPASSIKTDTWLGKFADNINYGGPINSIITVPINLLNTLFQSFGGTCQSFNMGAILGKNITFNCFTLESILGSSITNVIDMLCSFFIYYHLILFIISIYRKIMNLEELDDYLPQHLYHPKHGDYNDYNF